MIELEVDDVVFIHDQIIATSGGLGGIKDSKQLGAAVARPRQSAFGEELHKDIFAKAASILDSIANNHPFVDGNKRTAMAAATFYLFLNAYGVSFSNQEYEDFMLHVVKNHPSATTIGNWLKAHSSAIA